MTEKAKVPEVSLELHHNLVAELLDAYGWLGEFPVKRYDGGVLEDMNPSRLTLFIDYARMWTYYKGRNTGTV